MTLLTRRVSKSIISSPASSGIGCKPPLIDGSKAGVPGTLGFHALCTLLYPASSSSCSGLLIAQSALGRYLLLGVAAAEGIDIRHSGEGMCCRSTIVSTATMLFAFSTSSGKGVGVG